MAKKSDFEPEFLIVRASAGSGKTFRLVQEYLRCCLRFDDPGYFRKILAITFTNKAAQEMKDRVLSDVREVAQGKGSMFEEMVAVLQLDPDEIQRRAEKLGQSILHRYEDFGVMTIDENNFVKEFEEKPILNEVMNIGYYYLSSKHNSFINEQKNLLSLIDVLIKNSQLKCYQHNGIHITINTIAELNYAEDNIEKIL